MSNTLVKITNDQQAFEFIRDHLLLQGARSIDIADSGCGYRGISETDAQDIISEHGHGFTIDIDPYLSCAVGCIIDDLYYEQSLEGNACQDEAVVKAISNSHPDWEITESSVIMMMNLQFIHDRVDPILWDNVFNDPINITPSDLKKGLFFGNYKSPEDRSYEGSTKVPFVDKLYELDMCEPTGWLINPVRPKLVNNDEDGGY